jgi:hypothetical protein
VSAAQTFTQYLAANHGNSSYTIRYFQSASEIEA